MMNKVRGGKIDVWCRRVIIWALGAGWRVLRMSVGRLCCACVELFEYEMCRASLRLSRIGMIEDCWISSFAGPWGNIYTSL